MLGLWFATSYVLHVNSLLYLQSGSMNGILHVGHEGQTTALDDKNQR